MKNFKDAWLVFDNIRKKLLGGRTAQGNRSGWVSSLPHIDPLYRERAESEIAAGRYIIHLERHDCQPVLILNGAPALVAIVDCGIPKWHRGQILVIVSLFATAGDPALLANQLSDRIWVEQGEMSPDAQHPRQFLMA